MELEHKILPTVSLIREKMGPIWDFLMLAKAGVFAYGIIKLNETAHSGDGDLQERW